VATSARLRGSAPCERDVCRPSRSTRPPSGVPWMWALLSAPTKQHSSGGKDRLGSISKQGDRYLCSLFGRSSRCTELMPLAGGHPPPDEASLRRTFRKFYSASTKSADDAEADIACTTFRTASTASQRARSLEGSICLRRKDRLTRSEALHNGRRRQAGC
jgi:hypothetical protein